MEKEGLKENEREGIDRESKLGRGNTHKEKKHSQMWIALHRVEITKKKFGRSAGR
jgi:hypothetical protein